MHVRADLENEAALGEVLGVGVSAQMFNLLPVDEDCRPGPRRTQEEFPEVRLQPLAGRHYQSEWTKRLG